jgi:Ca2+-binding EF-hand superfamily protein
MLERFDANGNGRLDPGEMRGVARQFKPQQAKPQQAKPAEQSGSAATTESGTSPESRAAACLTPDALDRFDRNSDGRLSAAERRAARSDAALMRAVAATLMRFDADGDGKLNTAERHAARSALARLRAPPAKSPQDAESPALAEALPDEKP